MARNLISRMVSHDAKIRPDADEVLKHPFFWDQAKQLMFFQVSIKVFMYIINLIFIF